jgi:hypothetical protein
MGQTADRIPPPGDQSSEGKMEEGGKGSGTDKPQLLGSYTAAEEEVR